MSVFSGDVMIVEDNFIIAMDAEELVTELGASAVHLASDIAGALALLSAQTLTAAILDFNIEGGTSEAVADALTEKGVPFVFATGYSDTSMLPERYKALRLLKKPYSRDDIAEAFEARTNV
ncbi:response regulator [uncultured Algimonas sp.]|uniref:response regulator n=1 Tax=uncultured Algimonas sp. TaxID=1547920 RepID=UPI00262ACF48|nr:response regulator [uncultured Algimonas sp.]